MKALRFFILIRNSVTVCGYSSFSVGLPSDYHEVKLPFLSPFIFATSPEFLILQSIMKILKKTLKITGITLLVLLILAFLIPVLFKKQITTLVKKEINKSLTANVDFRDVSLSLFRHFPKVSIALEDLSVVGTDEFANDTLLSAKNFDASVNLMSVIKGDNIKVHGIYLESPRIHALVNKEWQSQLGYCKRRYSSNYYARH